MRSPLKIDANSHNLVVFYNPLPETLNHYEKELAASVRAAGYAPQSLHLRSERRAGMSKVVAAFAHVGKIATLARSKHRVIIIWPLLGWLDYVLLRSFKADGQKYFIMHDPVPLRRQVGMGRLARMLASFPSRYHGPTVVYHNSSAMQAGVADVPRQHAKRAIHPILQNFSSNDAGARGSDIQSGARVAPRPGTIAVLGQYKPARNLKILSEIGSKYQPSQLTIYGRGWPEVEGWRRVDKFLSEIEMDTAIQANSIVLLPYRYYFQSGISVRALEGDTPVVGARTEFLEDLFGEDFPGLVSDPTDISDWMRAVREVSSWDPASRKRQYARRAVEEWRALLLDPEREGPQV